MVDTPPPPPSYIDDTGTIQDSESAAPTSDDMMPGINIGTLPIGITPSLYVDGVKVDAIYDSATGTLNPLDPLSEGAHEITYTLTDEFNQESPQSGPISISVDTVAPLTTAAITAPRRAARPRMKPS